MLIDSPYLQAAVLYTCVVLTVIFVFIVVPILIGSAFHTLDMRARRIAYEKFQQEWADSVTAKYPATLTEEEVEELTHSNWR